MSDLGARERAMLPWPLGGRGRQAWIATLAAGGVLGGLTLVVPILLDDADAFGFLAILLGMIASVYLGYALADGRLGVFGIEYTGLVIFAGAAVVGLSLRSAWILAAGYLGHSVWDAIHHRRGVDTRMPGWYVPLCLGYDAVVALYALVRFA